MQSIPSKSIQKTAAYLLSAVLQQLFPKAALLGAEWSDVSFSYSLEFPFPLIDSLKEMIQDQMMSMIEKGKAFQIQEMIPSNAAEMFTYVNQPHLAKKAADSHFQLVSIWQLDSFKDLCQEPSFKVDFPGVVQLVSLEFLPKKELPLGVKQGIKIIGVAAANKQVLKKMLIKRGQAKGKKHLDLGQKMGLFSVVKEGVLWLRKGQRVLEGLKAIWKNELKQRQIDLLKTPFSFKNWANGCKENRHLLSKNSQKQCAEWGKIQKGSPPFLGLLSQERESLDLIMVLSSLEEVELRLISSLQFIIKMINILGLECCYRLNSKLLSSKKGFFSGKQKKSWLINALKACHVPFFDNQEDVSYHTDAHLEVRIVDALGQEWTGPSLTFSDDSSKSFVCWTFSLFGPIERFIALLIEQKGGDLPFWLHPELVRVVSVGTKKIEAARLIVDHLETKGCSVGLDDSDCKLAEKIHSAEVAKIPYIVVLGDKELKTQQLTVRKIGSSKKENFSQMSLEQLVQELKAVAQNEEKNLKE